MRAKLLTVLGIAMMLVLGLGTTAASAAPAHPAHSTRDAYACVEYYFYPYYGGVLEDNAGIVYNNKGTSLQFCWYPINSMWNEWQLNNIYAGTSSASCLTWNQSGYVFDFIPCAAKASQLFWQGDIPGGGGYEAMYNDYNGTYLTNVGIGYAVVSAPEGDGYYQWWSLVNV